MTREGAKRIAAAVAVIPLALLILGGFALAAPFASLLEVIAEERRRGPTTNG